MGSALFSTRINLLDGLVMHNITLPSTCGGIDTCGRYKVILNPNVN
jgi:Na+-transporting NADH:ubiquinone oxidoreductase subunit NqrF